MTTTKCIISTLAFWLLLSSQSAIAQLTGSHSVYEKGDGVWFVAHVYDTGKSGASFTSHSPAPESIFIVHCTSHSCEWQSIGNPLDFEIAGDRVYANWAALLTWDDDFPLLISSDLRYGLPVLHGLEPAPGPRLLSSRGMDFGAFYAYPMQGMLGPKELTRRNSSVCGVSRHEAGGMMAIGGPEQYDLRSWVVSIQKRGRDRNEIVFRFKGGESGVADTEFVVEIK